MADASAHLTRRALLIAPAVGLVSPAHAQDVVGAVTEVRGEAAAELRRERRALAAAAPIFLGDLVTTSAGARAGLRLGRATVLRLGERVRVTVDRFLADAGGTLTLGSGALLLDRPPGGSSGGVEIRTTFGLIAVRGTRVFVGPSAGVFAVFVARGRVSVTGGGTTVELEAGQGVDVPTPGGPPAMPRRWAEARVRRALAQVR
jgi:hypothetical protein